MSSCHFLNCKLKHNSILYLMQLRVRTVLGQSLTFGDGST